jgi:CRP/FNR family cyclic AMP-dependent transcriptional regulator
MRLLDKILARPLQDDAASSRVPARRMRSIRGSGTAERAAEMLLAPGALVQLSAQEARAVVAYMKPHRIREGVTFIREGDTEQNDFMLLVLEGEVTVESAVASRNAPITVTVLGPGSLIGEMGLVDGQPRSASCTASSPVCCAVLSRKALSQLLHDDALTAAKLMMAISQRIAQRMRECQEKIKLYSQLTQAMNEEINELMPL